MTKRASRRKNKHFICRLKKNYREQIKRQLTREMFLLSKSDINSLSLNVPSLKDEDTLFVARDDTKGTGNFPSDDEILMQNGYASASIRLLNPIKISKDRLLKESYINPVMFCFRQYLELTMKDSLLRFRLWRKNPSRGEANLDGHNLSNLWRDLKQYIGPKDNEVYRIERLVEELNAVDEDGTLFRYNEFLTNSIKNKEKTRPLIDVDALYLRILQMYRFFEGVNEMARNGLDEIVDNR